jgi:hypothetical protein
MLIALSFLICEFGLDKDSNKAPFSATSGFVSITLFYLIIILINIKLEE